MFQKNETDWNDVSADHKRSSLRDIINEINERGTGSGITRENEDLRTIGFHLNYYPGGTLSNSMRNLFESIHTISL